MKFKTVLTNGVVELDVKCHRYDASVNLGDHILAKDGRDQYYIDGIRAHFVVKIEEDPEWDKIMDSIKNYDFTRV